MDSSSRSASPREPSRPSHRPPSPPAAFDNKAYQHDDADSNHNTDNMSNGKGHANDSFGANGEAKTLEAVNLELVNLAPKNGNAKKKEVEVELNVNNNPYEEYFVPVNEHKKYMRGEKLYVTADKRGEKSSCKRPLCWTILGLVVAAIIVLIVLAATGILFSNSPTPVGEYNETISSARALNGITQMVDHDHLQDHDHSLDHEHDHDHNEIHDHEHVEPEPTAMEDSQGHLPNDGNADETNKNLQSTIDESMYVPRTLEGELTIDNDEFSDALMDHQSQQYKDISEALSRALTDAFSVKGQDNGEYELHVEISDIRKGSIVVTYRIHWKPKDNFENTEDTLMSKSLNESLRNYLMENAGMLSNYHVVTDAISMKRVLDLCKINNNNCEQKCEFNEAMLNFKCTCYSGYNINPVTMKCEFGVIDSEQKKYKVISFENDTVTPKNIPENEKSENVYISSNERMYDRKEIHQHETSTSIDHNVSAKINKEIESNNQQTTIRSMEESHQEQELKHESSVNENTEVIPLLEPTAEQTVEPETQPEPVTEFKSHIENIMTEPTPEPVSNSSTQLPPVFTLEDEIHHETSLHPNLIHESVSSTEHEPIPTPQSTEENNSFEMKINNSRTELEPTPEPKSSEENMSGTEVINSQSEPKPIPKPEINYEYNKPEMEINTSQNENNSSFNPSTLIVNHNIFAEENSNNMETNVVVETTTDLTVETKSWLNEDMLVKLNIPSTGDYTANTTVNENNGDVENEHLFSRARNIVIESESDTELPLPTTTERKMSIESQNEYKFNAFKDEKRDEMDEYLSHDIKNMTQKSFNSLNADLIVGTTTQTKSEEKVNTNELNDSKEDAISEEFIVTNQTFTSTQMPPSTENTLLNKSGETGPSDSKNYNVLFSNIQPQENSEEHMETTTIVSSNSVNPTLVKEYIENHTVAESDEVTIESETDSDFLEDVTKTPTTLFPKQENKIKETDKNTQSIISAHHPEITTLEPAEVTDYISSNEELEQSNKTNMVLFKKNQDHQVPLNEINQSDERISSSNEDDHSYRHNETTVSYYMLYDRSSKSIISESNEILSTTDSSDEETLMIQSTIKPPFLDSSETNESNYQNSTKAHKDVMTNKFDNSSENNVTIVTKENFETDYTNAMEPQSPQDHNNPSYQLLHESQNNEKESLDFENRKNESSETLSNSFNVNFETTTVIDYIYRKNYNDENATEITTEINNTTNQKETEFKDKTAPNPAPVWEEEESYLEKQTMEDDKMEHMLENDETRKQENHNMNNTSDTISEITTSGPIDQNKTTVSNINVTIYEIASHNLSNLASTERTMAGTITRYEEHEHEMNPFLPEIENNKSLVKKLQEGHDLESLHFNETHDSHEEHVIIPTEQENEAKNETAKTTLIHPLDNVPITENEMKEHISNVSTHTNDPTESNPDHLHSQDTNEINTRKMDEPIEKETISPFLLDTSDLITSTARTTINDLNTEVRSDFKEARPSMKIPEEGFVDSSINPVNNTDSLGVIPLLPNGEEKHMIFKKSKIIDIHDINDISDTPKKSDKRTFVSKMESKYEV